MSSSPVEEVDSKYLVGEVVLSKGNDPRKSCIMVEGVDDETVYKRFISSADCEIIICHGKENLIAAITMLNQNGSIEGYLGITDADFDILNESVSIINILLTDGHDLETMILNSRAFDKLIEIRLRGEESTLVDTIKNEIRSRLFEIGSMLGYIRLVSQRHSWSVEVHTFKYLKHLDEDCRLQFSRCVEESTATNPNIDPNKFSQEEFNALVPTYAIHLCKGHELIDILGRIFSKIVLMHLRKRVNPGGDLSSQLFLAYEYEMFKSSRLFSEIRDWEQTNPRYRVLAD